MTRSENGTIDVLRHRYKRIFILMLVIPAVFAAVLLYIQGIRWRVEYTSARENDLLIQMEQIHRILAQSEGYINSVNKYTRAFLSRADIIDNSVEPEPFPVQLQRIEQYPKELGRVNTGDIRDDYQTRVELSLARSIYQLMVGPHLEWPFLQWSYYLSSRDILMLYPYPDQFDIPRRNGSVFSPQEIIQTGRMTEWWNEALPENNSGGKPFWTSPYYDSISKSWITTYSAPLLIDDEFRGILGFDITLNFLTNQIHAIRGWDSLHLSTGNGQILTSTDALLVTGDPRTIDNVFDNSEEAAAILEECISDPGNIHQKGPMMAIAVPDTSFYLVGKLDMDQWMNSLVTEILVISGFFVVLIVVLIVWERFLQRKFISPAFGIADYVESRVAGIEVEIPVEEDWNTRFQAIAESFDAKEQADNLRIEYEEQLKKLAAELERTSEIVRREIASDLHDSVGQMLSSVALQFENRIRHSRSSSGEGEEILEMLRKAIRELRDMIFRMSPPVLDRFGLVAALHELAERKQRSFPDIAFIVQSIGEWQLPTLERTVLYRLAQELVHNAVKHAEPQSISISLTFSETVNLRIEDDGKGFQRSSAEGIGLFSCRERIKRFGGQFSIDTETGTGTAVTVVLPVLRDAV